MTTMPASSPTKLTRFITACAIGDLDTVNAIAPRLLNVRPSDIVNAFNMACVRGHVYVVATLLDMFPGAPFLTNDYETFRHVCEVGHAGVVTELVRHFHIPVDVAQHGFDISCRAGNAGVMRTLYTHCVEIDPTRDDDKLFRDTCAANITDCAVLLRNMFPQKYGVVTELGDIADWFVFDRVICIAEVVPKHVVEETCPICLVSPCSVETACGHTFCNVCVASIAMRHNPEICPLCRGNTTYTVYTQFAEPTWNGGLDIEFDIGRQCDFEPVEWAISLTPDVPPGFE